MVSRSWSLSPCRPSSPQGWARCRTQCRSPGTCHGPAWWGRWACSASTAASALPQGAASPDDGATDFVGETCASFCKRESSWISWSRPRRGRLDGEPPRSPSTRDWTRCPPFSFQTNTMYSALSPRNSRLTHIDWEWLIRGEAIENIVQQFQEINTSRFSGGSCSYVEMWLHYIRSRSKLLTHENNDKFHPTFENFHPNSDSPLSLINGTIRQIALSYFLMALYCMVLHDKVWYFIALSCIDTDNFAPFKCLESRYCSLGFW